MAEERIITEDAVRYYVTSVDVENKMKCGECGVTIANHYYNAGLQDREKSTDQKQVLADGIALILLAEWIAIEHGKTRLQAKEFMDKAQELFDYIHVIGFRNVGNSLEYTAGQKNAVKEIFDELDYSIIPQGKKWLCIDPKRYQTLKSRYNIKDNKE